MGVVTCKRLVWLDFLKGLAILGVVVNHVFDVRVPKCPSELVCQLTFYSVLLFVLCGGIAAAMSLEKCTEHGQKWKKMLARVVSLIGYYTFALILTELLAGGKLDFFVFLSSWLAFPDQFYFVLFFSELLLVSPILYALLAKYRGRYVKSIAILVALMLVSLYLMFYSEVTGVYGGGGRLLGGSYLLLFSMGCFFALNVTTSVTKTLLGMACPVLAMMGLAIALKYFAGGAKGLVWALNPPGLLRMGYAIVVFVLFYALIKVEWVQTTYIVKGVAWLGRKSLDVFLYHMLVLVALRKLFPNMTGGIWALCCCFLLSLGGVLVGKGVKWAVVRFRQCY